MNRQSFLALLLLACFSYADDSESIHSPRSVSIIHGPVFNSSTGNTYYLLSEASWDESQAFCVANGGNLVTINDEEENNWLLATFLAVLPEYNNFWTGFSDQVVEGVWVWISGEPVTYTNWAPGQPDDAGGEDYCWLIGVNYPEYKDWNDVPNTGLLPWGSPNGILEIEGMHLAPSTWGSIKSIQ